jgi:hypothetical protein
VSPVRYELGFYIPEDGILHSHRHEHLKCYTAKDSFLSYPFKLLLTAVQSFHAIQSPLLTALINEL